MMYLLVRFFLSGHTCASSIAGPENTSPQGYLDDIVMFTAGFFVNNALLFTIGLWTLQLCCKKHELVQFGDTTVHNGQLISNVSRGKISMVQSLLPIVSQIQYCVFVCNWEKSHLLLFPSGRSKVQWTIGVLPKVNFFNHSVILCAI